MKGGALDISSAHECCPIHVLPAPCEHSAFLAHRDGAFLLMGSYCVSAPTHGTTKTEGRHRTPEDGSVIYSAHPHFSWEAVAAPELDNICEIQIATDRSFSHMAGEDFIENVL